MGGCCCCFPRITENPRTIEEHVPLSHARPSSVVSTEMDETNVEMLAPNVYSSIPPPAPFDFSPRNILAPLRLPSYQNNNEAHEPTNAGSTQETMNNSGIEVSHGTAEKDALSGNNQTDPDPKKQEMELSMIFQEPVEEDVCPICLEEYEIDNPEMLTKCNHHFHLACILEWMERSDACPVCDKELVLVES